ncbi:MAG: glyoxalase superfamily protein [Pseudomonadota bacterium]
MSETTFERTMPILDVTDMTRSVAFYRDQLGFRTNMRGEPATFTICQRDTITIGLCLIDGAPPKAAHWSAYLYVSSVDDIHDEFRAANVAITSQIGDRFYGCRDFDITDPDGYILAFGQALNTANDDLGPGLGPATHQPQDQPS